MRRGSFGNSQAKVERYLAFWNRLHVSRPLVGFTFRGWFPLEEYRASRLWANSVELTPDMIVPEDFLADEDRLLQEGEKTDDDLLRGASPASAIVPWLEAVLGAKLRLLPGSVLAAESFVSWETLESIRIDKSSPWCRKYFQFADSLVRFSGGRFPVSHSALSGPSDLMGTFRGHSQSIIDLMDKPEQSKLVLWNLAEQFKDITVSLWERLPRFFDGYFDSMYQLWAPGPIIRMQEDASALYSPSLYRKFLQPIDKMLASSFDNAFVHLHSTSMIVLGGFLEIEELGCFEINNDASGPPLSEMIPYFRKVQSAGRSLLIRGSFTVDELHHLQDTLEARGLMLLILVKDYEEIDRLRSTLGL